MESWCYDLIILICSASPPSGLAWLSVRSHASAAPAQISKIEAKTSLVQTVGYKKRRTYVRGAVRFGRHRP